METKGRAKITCNVCKHGFRSDNLMRHVYSHKNTMTSFINPERLKFCVNNRMPVMLPNEKDWIICLICRKTAHVGGRGLTVKEFIENYKSLHSKCIGCFDTVKDLFEPPKNVMLEETKPIEKPIEIPIEKPIENTELIELQKKLADLQAEYDRIDAAYNKFMDDTTDEVIELNKKIQTAIDSKNDIIEIIRDNITDEDTLELFADYL